MRKDKSARLLEQLREGKQLAMRQQLLLIVHLSVPAIFAQISSIIMEYIDASMVGSLGANASASIGLVASSTWLLGGLTSAYNTGFSVQIAHRIGAGDGKGARRIMKQGLVTALLYSLVLLSIGAGISRELPRWLGGDSSICREAFHYFLVYSLALPVMQMNLAAGAMLQSSGNMRLPSILHVLMCFLDILFNLVLIFPSRSVLWMGHRIFIPGMGLGVLGAALGTALAQLVIMLCMMYFLLFRSPMLHLRKEEKLRFCRKDIQKAVRISVPVAVEQFIMSGAQIMSTRIVAPLGMIAIAANSFSITAESLCYMPGYGIGSAATTLIGQSVGAGRHDLTKRLGWIATCFGMLVMAVSGACMYLLAPWMISILSPDEAIRQLGTSVLRIEAFAEPMYAASIVASGVFRGVGDTLIPSCLNFCSMWLVRLPLAAFLAPKSGLRGVWIAMCIELCFRGVLFLLRLAFSKNWDQADKRHRGKLLT